MTNRNGIVTRREFVMAMGAIGGAGAAYHALTAMGLLGIPKTYAASLELPAGSLEDITIVVIGGGLAGLCAAYRAANAGAKVTVLEATERYGGRSLTVRPKGDKSPNNVPYYSEYREWDWNEPSVCNWTKKRGLYLNTGPGRIPQHHETVLHYCRKLGVKLEPYIFIDEANLLQTDAAFGGKPVPIRQIKYNLFGYIAEMLAKVENPARLNGPMDAGDIEAFRSMLTSFGNLQKSKAGDLLFKTTPRAGYSVEPGAGLNAGVELTQPSLEHILETEFWNTGLFKDFEYFWQTSLMQPVGGMDMIWRAFLQAPVEVGLHGKKGPLWELVHRNSPVTRIDIVVVEDGNKVQVTCGGTNACTTKSYDYCISTMATHILGNTAGNFIDAPTRSILKSVDYIPACKVGWQAKTRFWEKEDRIYGGISWTTDIISQIWYPSSGFHEEFGVLTGAYNRGDQARQFQAMTVAERIKAALAGGEKLHPGFADKVFHEKPKQGLTIAWAKMPYQVGGWANDTSETQPDLYPKLIGISPIGNKVYLAGDYFSYWPGWQVGALDSAHLATDDIARRVRG